MVADSPRVLNHEQFHLNLACALARKANRLLAGGTAFSVLNGVIHARLRDTQIEYDRQSNHGCASGAQASWEGAILADLPKVALP